LAAVEFVFRATAAELALAAETAVLPLILLALELRFARFCFASTAEPDFECCRIDWGGATAADFACWCLARPFPEPFIEPA
jgi:hypothetical protein